MNSTLPGGSAAAPQPPFESVQVMDCLPPAPSAPPSCETASSKRVPLRRDNLTGLVRSEIRLLAEAVEEARTWRGTLVGHEDPEAEKALEQFDARIERMRAAIRKLKAASGYTFSGKSGRGK